MIDSERLPSKAAAGSYLRIAMGTPDSQKAISSQNNLIKAPMSSNRYEPGDA